MTMYPPPAPKTADGDTALTVPWMLKNPKFFQRRISDMTRNGDYGAVIFGNGGIAESGAAAYQVAEENVYTSDSKPEDIAPGTEYPEIEFSDETLKTIAITKNGGKFKVADELARRNSVGIVNQRTTLLANTVLLKDQQRALAVLTAAVSSYSRSASGNNWSTFGALTNSTVTVANKIAEDLAKGVSKPEAEESPYNYSLMIMNPQEYILLVSILGSGANLSEFLKGLGIDRFIVTGLQAKGSVKYVDPGMVGLRFYEVQDGIETKVYRDENTDSNVVKAANRRTYVVTDPLAIWEQTAVGAS